MDKIEIYCMGPLSCSVCAPKGMEQSEILRQVEVREPSGTSNGWMISDDKIFKTGEPMPNQCEDEGNRQHWFVVV